MTLYYLQYKVTVIITNIHMKHVCDHIVQLYCKPGSAQVCTTSMKMVGGIQTKMMTHDTSIPTTKRFRPRLV